MVYVSEKKESNSDPVIKINRRIIYEKETMAVMDMTERTALSQKSEGSNEGGHSSEVDNDALWNQYNVELAKGVLEQKGALSLCSVK